MHTKWVFKHFSARSGRQIRILAALWTMSLLTGIVLCCLSRFDAFSEFRFLFSDDPAPLSLFLVCVFPVVLIAIALTASLFGLVCLTVTMSGVSHGFCGIMIYIAQGSAAWLLRPMLLFSASFVSVLMWWLILQNETSGRLRKNIRLAGVLSCVVFVIDLFIVSPIVGDLVKYF